MSDDAFLSFELLGVAFSLSGNPGEMQRLLETRYESLQRTRTRKDRRCSVTIENREIGWEISSDERSARVVPHADEALDLVDTCVIQGLMQQRPDLAYAHAGVVSVGGTGIALPGLARTGKSLLVLALIQAGARFLSDELLICDRLTREFLPFPLAIRLGEAGTSHFPDLVPHFHPLGNQRLISPRALGHDVVSESVPASTIIIPVWDPAQPDELSPVPTTEALDHLLQTEIPTSEPPAPGTPSLNDTLAAVRTHTLRWRDPHSAATLLIEALS